MSSPTAPSPRGPRAPGRRARRLAAIPLLGAGLVALLGAGLTACSTSGGDELTVYSGRTEDLIGPLLEQYAEETGADIAVRYGDSAELALQIGEEGDSSPADVFISQNPGPVVYLDQKGMLDTLSADVLELAPVEAQAADGTWVGLSGRQRVLVYNEEMVDEADLPTSVLDLTDEAYAGKVGVAPSNGSFQDFVTIMRQRLGDEAAQEWLEGMAANDSPTYQNNNAIVEAVGRGEIPMGLVNHYYNVRALTEDPSLPSRNHLFEDGDVGATFIVTAASVLTTANDKAAAEDLVSFLLSEEAQTYFADETKEYPLAAGVPVPEELGAFDLTQIEAIDPEVLGDDLQSTLEMIEASGLNT